MASNFDFLKDIDNELYSSILDAEKLFRDGYFTQCCVQLRVYAEKTAKKVLGNVSKDLTFDDTINCLKDKIKSEQEKEFIDDLFFIKREGNKCAHGEDADPTVTLEAIKRAFEIAINYAFAKQKDKKILKLQFDETLLVTQKQKEKTLVEKYVELAQKSKEELLNSKQGEFIANTPKTNDGIKDESYVENLSKYKNKKQQKKKKEPTPAQIKVKEKIKEAKKNLKENINSKNTPKSKNTKTNNKKRTKKSNKNSKQIKKLILFIIFVTISLYFLILILFFD